jgi:hypothetical protein
MGIVFVKTQSEKYIKKKGKLYSLFQITNVFNTTNTLNKSNPIQQTFLEDLVLYVTKVIDLCILLKIYR